MKILLLASLLVSASLSSWAAVIAGKAAVIGRVAYTVAPAGSLYKGEARMPRSLIFSDSKASASHLPRVGPGAQDKITHRDTVGIAKIYDAPGYQEDLKLAPGEISRLAASEAQLLNELAADGLGARVVETGAAEDGTPFNVIAKPKRAPSVANLIKKGSWARVEAKAKRLVSALVEKGYKLDRFDPTQLLEGKNGLIVIKTRQGDGRVAPNEAGLDAYYAKRLDTFKAMAEMLPVVKANGPALSDGKLTTEPLAVARLMLEAIRTQKTVRVVYINRAGQRKVAHVLPLKESLKDHNFLKGDLKVIYFPETSKSKKPYGMRLSGILEAKFL